MTWRPCDLATCFRWEQLLGRTKLALELPLRPHPRVLNVVGVDGGVVRIKKVLSMCDHIVQVDAQLFLYILFWKIALIWIYIYHPIFSRRPDLIPETNAGQSVS